MIPTPGALSDLPPESRDDLETELDRVIDGASFFQRENPLVRHLILRKRTTLEELDRSLRMFIRNRAW